MRFMMLMIPLGYETAPPDVQLDPERVKAMMKYNEALQGRRRADRARRPASAVDGRAGLVCHRQARRHRRPLHRSQGSARRLLDDQREVARGGDRLGEKMPGLRERDHRNPPGAGNGRFLRGGAAGGRGLRRTAEGNRTGATEGAKVDGSNSNYQPQARRTS